MSDISDLTKAAEALDHYDETDHADAVRAYVDSRLGYWSRFYQFTKTVIMYAFIFGGTAVGFYGAYRYTMDGGFYAALGILFVTSLFYGIIAVINRTAKAFESIIEDDATTLELSGKAVGGDDV